MQIKRDTDRETVFCIEIWKYYYQYIEAITYVYGNQMDDRLTMLTKTQTAYRYENMQTEIETQIYISSCRSTP